jgi:3,4-dihydroxy 2-butanone 4-phosphate synthase
VNSAALTALTEGRAIVVYDGNKREHEADLMLHAGFATPARIRALRSAGGLLCLATDAATAQKLGLPFAADLLRASGGTLRLLAASKTPYGDEPAFSIAINARDTFTGITDNDRATTAFEFAALVSDGCSAADFAQRFYSPGHVHLLIGRGLQARKGHTEIALELACRAGLSPAMLMCEMLGSGRALARGAALRYARAHRIPFVEGCEIWSG